MGGAIVQLAMRKAPHNYAGIVLLAPMPPKPPRCLAGEIAAQSVGFHGDAQAGGR